MKSFTQFIKEAHLTESVDMMRLHKLVAAASRITTRSYELQHENEYDTDRTYGEKPHTKDEYLSTFAPLIARYVIDIKPAKQKYIPLDMNGGGKVLVIINDMPERHVHAGDFIGIKAYGVPHFGKRYGNLSTMKPVDLAFVFSIMNHRFIQKAAIELGMDGHLNPEDMHPQDTNLDGLDESVEHPEENPFHATLLKHGFVHKSSAEGPYKKSEWHQYEHPTNGRAKATVYPSGHPLGETHWEHDHSAEHHGDTSSSAGRTAKSLNDYLSHPDGKNAKIRGVVHRRY